MSHGMTYPECLMRLDEIIPSLKRPPPELEVNRKGMWWCDYCKSPNLLIRCERCGAPIPKRYYDRRACY